MECSCMRHALSVSHAQQAAAAHRSPNVSGTHKCGPSSPQAQQQPARKASSNSIDPTSCTEAEEGGLALYIEDRGAQAVAQRIACFVLIRIRMQH